MSATASPLAGMLATGVHTIAYLAVTGLVAWVVYRKLGLALLRKTWFNFDLLWAAALVATGLGFESPRAYHFSSVSCYLAPNLSKVMLERNDWTPPTLSIASRCDCGMTCA